MEAIDYKKLDAMYVYLQTIGQGIDPDRFRVRLERVPIRTLEQLRYIKLCMELCPQLLNCCWLAEDGEGSPLMELVIRCSWAYYQKQQRNPPQQNSNA